MFRIKIVYKNGKTIVKKRRGTHAQILFVDTWRELHKENKHKSAKITVKEILKN